MQYAGGPDLIVMNMNIFLRAKDNSFAGLIWSPSLEFDIYELHAADTEVPEDMDRSDTETHMYTAESIGAVQGHGKKWFANIKMNGGSQRCQLDSGATCDVMSIKDMRRLAPEAKLLPSQTRLVLYSGQSMHSIGIFQTECVVRGKAHKLRFEIVRSGQRPLLSGETSERLGLMLFTIPEELLMVGHGSSEPLTRQHLVQTYHDVFNDPVESLPGDVHFELNKDVAPVQASPRNVPVALRDAVKAQLDKYERDGHLTSVSEPTEWISNMVIVRQPEKLRICIDLMLPSRLEEGKDRDIRRLASEHSFYYDFFFLQSFKNDLQNNLVFFK